MITEKVCRVSKAAGVDEDGGINKTWEERRRKLQSRSFTELGHVLTHLAV